MSPSLRCVTPSRLPCGLGTDGAPRAPGLTQRRCSPGLRYHFPLRCRQPVAAAWGRVPRLARHPPLRCVPRLGPIKKPLIRIRGWKRSWFETHLAAQSLRSVIVVVSDDGVDHCRAPEFLVRPRAFPGRFPPPGRIEDCLFRSPRRCRWWTVNIAPIVETGKPAAAWRAVQGSMQRLTSSSTSSTVSSPRDAFRPSSFSEFSFSAFNTERL